MESNRRAASRTAERRTIEVDLSALRSVAVVFLESDVQKPSQALRHVCIYGFIVPGPLPKTAGGTLGLSRQLDRWPASKVMKTTTASAMTIATTWRLG